MYMSALATPTHWHSFLTGTLHLDDGAAIRGGTELHLDGGAVIMGGTELCNHH